MLSVCAGGSMPITTGSGSTRMSQSPPARGAPGVVSGTLSTSEPVASPGGTLAVMGEPPPGGVAVSFSRSSLPFQESAKVSAVVVVVTGIVVW
jgi:hypothetical protein